MSDAPSREKTMVLVKRKCPHCDGKGRIDTINEYNLVTGYFKCLICNGTGKIWDKVRKPNDGE